MTEAVGMDRLEPQALQLNPLNLFFACLCFRIVISYQSEQADARSGLRR